jgi:hypothetical protein
VTGAATDKVTVRHVTRTGPGSVTVDIAPLSALGPIAGAVIELVDDTGTIVDVVGATPPPTSGIQSSVVVLGARPGSPGQPRVRLQGPPRAAVLPCTCALHTAPGGTPAAVRVDVLDGSGGLAVAAAPVPEAVSPR